MIFHSITIKNFRTVGKSEITIPFPEAPGLYYMRGRNEVDSRLTGNAAGKSTVWEALCWLLYGKTSEGLKAEAICNWDSEKGGTSVSLAFSFPDEEAVEWYLTRTWKPNSWTLSHAAEFITDEEVIDLTKDESNPILNDLRMEYEVFLTTVFLPQEGATFLDLKAEAQTTMFSKILGLERWTEYSAKASKMAGDVDRDNRRLEAQVAELKGRLDEGVVDYARQIAKFEEDRTRRLDSLQADYQKALDQHARVKVRREEHQDLTAGLQDQLDQAVEAEQVAAGIVRDLTDAMHDLLAHSKLLKAKAHELKVELEDLKANKECPTCGHTLSQSRRDQCLEDLVNHLKRIDKDPVWATLSRAEADLDQALKDLDRCEARRDKINDEYDRHLKEKQDMDRQLQSLDRDLDRMEDEAERIESERNPFREAQKEASGRARSLQDALKQAQQGLDKGYELFALYSLWIRGFKEVRLFEIRSSLDELTLEVNNALISLGMPGWSLHFDVDKENRKGGVQRGFNVTVRSPHTDKAVPWAAWSGGEKQRLRLAATMGLSNLVRSRSGVSLPVEAWDEPTKGLSPEGVQDLLATLEHRARVEQRAIWIIDHTAHEFGSFAGGVTMVKTQHGAQVEYDLGKYN